MEAEALLIFPPADHNPKASLSPGIALIESVYEPGSLSGPGLPLSAEKTILTMKTYSAKLPAPAGLTDTSVNSIGCVWAG